MNANTLIDAVRRRITFIRRSNFAIAILSLLLAGTLIWTIGRRGVVTPELCYPLWGAFLWLLLEFSAKCLCWLRPAASSDAAKQIDRDLSAKERFLTLATGHQLDPAGAQLINSQVERLAASYSPTTALPFYLHPQAKVGLLASPLLLTGLAVILWRYPVTATVAGHQLDSSTALQLAELRELAENSNSLPSEVREALVAVADSIEEHGLYTEETEEIVEEALQTVAEQEVIQQDVKQLDSTTGNKLPRPADEPPGTAKSSRDLPEQQPPAGEQPPPEEKNSTQQSDSTGESGSEPRKTDSPPPAQGEQTQDKSEQQGSGDKEQSDNQKQSGAGESPGTQQGSAEKKKQQGSQAGEDPEPESGDPSGRAARQKPGEAPEQNDPKRDVTGVGEGKGTGRSGDKKQQHGETSSGQDDAGAKEGEAKNTMPGDQGQDQQGAETGKQEEQQQKEQREREQQSNATSDSGGADPKKSGNAKGGQDQGNKPSDLQQAKQELEQLKNQQQRKQGGEQNDSSADKQRQQPSKEQGDASGTKGEQGGEQQLEQRPSDPQQSGADAKEAERLKPNNPGSTDRSRNDQSKPEQGEPGEPSSRRSSESQQKNSTTKRQQDPSGNSAKQNETENSSPSSRPDALPQPDPDAAGRGAPGGGDGRGVLDPDQAKKEQLELPLQEKIVVRGQGAEDPTLYRNKLGSKAKTAIGQAELKKPEVDTASQKQPIPVEYSDILR